MKRRLAIGSGLAAGLALAAGGLAPARGLAQEGRAHPAGSYKPLRPWRVLQGQLKPWQMTRGINTITVSGGMVVDKTLPASPQHVYRLEPGQAVALLYEPPRLVGERRAAEWGAFPFQWAKIIRKVGDQVVELKDYPGVLSEFHNTGLWLGVHDQSDMDHRFTGRLNPPLTRAEAWRTHGAWVFHSPEFAPWLNVSTRQGKADVAAVRGQLLTVHFLAHERDEAPWITIEVDFSKVAAAEPPAEAAASGAGTPPERASAAERRLQRLKERASSALQR